MAEAKEMMPYSEFVRHVAYHKLYPWGDDWQQAGTVAWASVQPHVKRRHKPSDFIPDARRADETSLVGMFGAMKDIALRKQRDE